MRAVAVLVNSDESRARTTFLFQPAPLHWCDPRRQRQHLNPPTLIERIMSSTRKAPSTTIQSLPSELIIAIVRAGKLIPLQKGSRNPPFNLLASHISQFWRNATLSAPELWAHLYLGPFRPIEELETYLQRSQGCLLDIILPWWLPFGHHHPTLGTAVERIHILAPHSQRWRSFRLTTSYASTMNCVVAELMVLKTPNLISLQFICSMSSAHASGTIDPDSPRPLFSSYLPKLTTLELRFIPVNSRIHPQDFLTLLSSCNGLENLTLHGKPVLTEGHGTPIDLPSLRSLAIGHHPSVTDYLGYLLHLFTAPNLVFLDLWTVSLREWVSFRSFISSSTAETGGLSPYPQLRSINFFSVSCAESDATYMRWLSNAFPLLDRVILSDSPTAIFLDCLLEDDHSFPELRTVTISFDGHNYLRIVELLGEVALRRGAVRFVGVPLQLGAGTELDQLKPKLLRENLTIIGSEDEDEDEDGEINELAYCDNQWRNIHWRDGEERAFFN